MGCQTIITVPYTEKWPGLRKDETHGLLTDSGKILQLRDRALLLLSSASQWSALPATKWLVTAQPSCWAPLQVLWVPASRPCPESQPAVLSHQHPAWPAKQRTAADQPLAQGRSPHPIPILLVASVSQRITLFSLVSFKIKIFWNPGHGCTKPPSCTIQSQCAWDEWRSQAARQEDCCPAATAQQKGKKMGWIYKEPPSAKL